MTRRGSLVVALTAFALAVLLGGGLALRALRPGIDSPNVETPPPSTAERAASSSGNVERGAAASATAKPSLPPRRLATAVPSVSVEDFKAHVRSFFEPPSLDEEGLFAVEAQPVTWACAGDPPTGRFSDLGVFARENGAPRVRYPAESRFSNLNQFLRSADRSTFVQVSAFEIEGGFALEMVTSDVADLSRETRRSRLAPEGDEPPLTRGKVVARMKAVVDGLVSDGFVLGASGVVVEPESKETPAEEALEIVGGRVTRIEMRGISCEGIKEARCTCTSDAPSVE